MTETSPSIYFITSGMQYLHPSLLRNLAHVSRETYELVRKAHVDAQTREHPRVIELRRACAIMAFDMIVCHMSYNDQCHECSRNALIRSPMITAMAYSSVTMLTRMKWANHIFEHRDIMIQLIAEHNFDPHKAMLMYAACAYDDIEFMRAIFDMMHTRPKNIVEYDARDLIPILVASCPQHIRPIDGHICGAYLEVRSRVQSVRIFAHVVRVMIDGYDRMRARSSSRNMVYDIMSRNIIRSLILANNRTALRAFTGTDSFPIDDFVTSLQEYDIDELFCDFAPRNMVRTHNSRRVISVTERSAIDTYHSSIIALVSRDSYDARDFDDVFHPYRFSFETDTDYKYHVIAKIGRVICMAIACDRIDIANEIMQRCDTRYIIVHWSKLIVNECANYVNNRLCELWSILLAASR